MMPLVSETFNLAPMEGGHSFAEHEFWTDCHECGEKIHLNESNLDESDPLETVYRCPRTQCNSVILIVSTPGVVPWEGRGYRIGEWLIRNPRDLFLQRQGAKGIVQMPASPNSLI